jgi:microtubule-associated protein, RP/EB family
VNWKAQHEYQYIINFKVLQSAFTAKKIDKVRLCLNPFSHHIGLLTPSLKHQPIPIERLVKCRMQDTLEFLQWMKRYWDQNYRGDGGYDALTQRTGSAMTMGGTPSLPSASSTSSYPSSSNSKAFGAGHGAWSSAGSVTGSETSRGSGSRSARGALSPFSAVSTGTSTTVSTRPSSRASSRPGNKIHTLGSGSGAGVEAKKVTELQSHLEELTQAVDSLTKERDFYWKKLREVEDLVGEVIEVKASAGVREGLKELERIREVLYREGDVE